MKHNNVYTTEEENSHRFYQLPKELFVNEKYKHINSDAKLLYALLLDRKELSRSNGWVDEFEQVYLLYTRQNIMEMLNVSSKTATKAFKQLSECNLIIEERQGLNKPNKIYVCRIEYGANSGHVENTSQDKKKVHYNDTERNETEKIKRYIIASNDDYVFQYYSFKYKEQFNKEHPTITYEQLKNVESLINEYRVDYDVVDEDWEKAIDKHFDNLPRNNNGSILAFASGDGFQSPLMRYLDIK